MFDMAAGLNACGYDDELETSDPVRRHVRDQINAALLASEAAREARDRLCGFVFQHRLSGRGRDLAQYVSLALYTTAPPALAASAPLPEMPPDSTQVYEVLPLLRAFAEAVDLHVIWLSNRAAYDDQVAQLHEPLTKMIVATNVYLKMPASTYDGRRFLVLLEPMLAPGAVNARVYGSDYVVVASPVNGQLHMKDVRHTYLHYEVEPLLFARSGATDRLLPILKSVREAPLDYVYRSDIVALVVECMVRAIEARTMETGVPAYKVPANVRRSEMERIDRERTLSEQKAEAVRQQAVRQSMQEGYVLTDYFYGDFKHFESVPDSLKEAIGEMVYGMDVQQQLRHVRDIEFVQQASSEVVSRAPRRLRGLDLAEVKLIGGDAAAAGELARQALDQKTAEADRANFILARCSLLSRDIDGAVERFEQTIRLSKDPRMLAWSHIYLGRIYDISDRRDEALVEYKAALTVRDGQADTRRAAEKGLKEPYSTPAGVQPREADEDAPPVPGAAKKPNGAPKD